MNRCFFIGNLTKDPEMRYSPKGLAIAALSLAINKRFKDQEGNQKDKVVFLDYTAFGRTAETMAQYLHKGSKIMIEAEADRQEWDDKQTGQKRSKIQFLVQSFEFCDSKGQGQSAAPSPRQKAAEAPQPDAPEETKPPSDYDDDSVPF